MLRSRTLQQFSQHVHFDPFRDQLSGVRIPFSVIGRKIKTTKRCERCVCVCVCVRGSPGTGKRPRASCSDRRRAPSWGVQVTFHPTGNEVDLEELLVGPYDSTVVLEELR